jgi:hypothetical protein
MQKIQSQRELESGVFAAQCFSFFYWGSITLNGLLTFSMTLPVKKDLNLTQSQKVGIGQSVIATAGRNLVFLECYIVKISHIRSK